MTKRRGQCPCHNPSDSGRARETGCDAILFWHRPERFQRRVCPLLTRSARGEWVCGVGSAQVRPFWGRWWGWHGAAAALVALTLGLGAWGSLRWVGYRVSLAQVFWPPKWSELSGVRTQFFIEQGKTQYEAGRIREAIASLNVAFARAPDDFAVGMMLAQFYQVGSPEGADRIYAHLAEINEERRNETMRVWFRSLLARGRWEQVADIARRQLVAEPNQANAWTHALVTASRQLDRTDWLESALADANVPVGARVVLALELAVRQAADRNAAIARLAEATVMRVDSYARLHHIGLLVEFGQWQDALRLLSEGRNELTGRDVVRMALASYAVGGDSATLAREVGQLLAPTRNVGVAEVTLLSQHLIRYPDPALAEQLIEAMKRVETGPRDTLMESYVNVLCALGRARDFDRFAAAKARVAGLEVLPPSAVQRIEKFFFESGAKRADEILPVLQSFGVEMTYAMLEGYPSWR
jgi:tetratricopeptide (TPR) repeat protein